MNRAMDDKFLIHVEIAGRGYGLRINRSEEQIAREAVKQIREKMSLCYAIGSGYYASKGIVTVSAGIDREQEQAVRTEVLAQLDACRRGEITQEELNAAKEALLSSLRGIHDSPASIESYYSTHTLSGTFRSAQQYMDEVRAVTMDSVVAAAETVDLHTTYFLRGAEK